MPPSGFPRVHRPKMVGHSNWMMDDRFMAMPPGKRVSRNGNVYWEDRKNRADKNPSKRH